MNRLFAVILFAVWFSISANAADNPRWALNELTDQGFFTLALQPKDGEPVIGDFHDWIIEVTDENGKGIENAEFRFDGGMAAHGHGLPSQPTVTQYLGEGKYLIEGLLFNMAGDWTLMVAVKKGSFIDTAQFVMTLDF